MDSTFTGEYVGSVEQRSVRSFHGRSGAASEMFDTPCLGTWEEGRGREGGGKYVRGGRSKLKILQTES